MNIKAGVPSIIACSCARAPAMRASAALRSLTSCTQVAISLSPPTCTNEEFGFTVSYPAGWWANEALTPEDPALTPIPACTYFAEAPVELQPNAGLPAGIAVIVDVADAPAGAGPTGVEVIDTSTADRFLKLARSVNLLGARCLITGIQPAVAQTLVELGVEFGSLETHRNLKNALQACVFQSRNEAKLTAPKV